MSLIRWFFGAFATLCVILFAISNRQHVEFQLTPFNATNEYPLYAIGLALFIFGFLLGAFSVWVNGAALRREKRRQAKTIKNLEKSLETATSRPTSMNTPETDLFPALEKKQNKIL